MVQELRLPDQLEQDQAQTDQDDLMTFQPVRGLRPADDVPFAVVDRAAGRREHRRGRATLAGGSGITGNGPPGGVPPYLIHGADLLTCAGTPVPGSGMK